MIDRVAKSVTRNPLLRHTLRLMREEGAEQVGWQLDEIILMLKPDWETPTAAPNPRITLATVDAKATQAALRVRGVAIADEVQAYGDFLVGSFLDSEGNKLWFCSPVNG